MESSEVLDSTKFKKCLIEFYDFNPSYLAKSFIQVDAGRECNDCDTFSLIFVNALLLFCRWYWQPLLFILQLSIIFHSSVNTLLLRVLLLATGGRLGQVAIRMIYVRGIWSGRIWQVVA